MKTKRKGISAAAFMASFSSAGHTASPVNVNETQEILKQAKTIKAIAAELIAELAALDELDAEEEGAL